MKEEIEKTEKLTKILTIGAAILAFFSGIAGLFALFDPGTGVSGWIAAGFAFISAILGVLVLITDKRKDNLEAKYKRAKPEIDVSIKTGENDKKFYVVIDSKNRIPLEFEYKIVTRNNRVISGIFLDWGKFYPDAKHLSYLELATINKDQVTDNYIELRFNYRSVFAVELHDVSLTGKIIKSYTLSQDKLYCLPVMLAAEINGGAGPE